MRESPITRDTLLIADADTKVKRRVTKLLFKCSMRQLHNELIASPDDGGLVGARHAETNDVIISDTIFRSLAPPQLRPMADVKNTSVKWSIKPCIVRTKQIRKALRKETVDWITKN